MARITPRWPHDGLPRSVTTPAASSHRVGISHRVGWRRPARVCRSRRGWAGARRSPEIPRCDEGTPANASPLVHDAHRRAWAILPQASRCRSGSLGLRRRQENTRFDGALRNGRATNSALGQRATAGRVATSQRARSPIVPTFTELIPRPSPQWFRRMVRAAGARASCTKRIGGIGGLNRAPGLHRSRLRPIVGIPAGPSGRKLLCSIPWCRVHRSCLA